MAKTNVHDCLFKWLISAMPLDFLSHYFKNHRFGSYELIDKEFIEKYDALKNDLEGDLLLAIEVWIDGQPHEVLILIEHKSKRENASVQVFKYACYAWLLRERPVWSIILYTDDQIWHKPMEDRFWYGLTKEGRLYHRCDILKINREMSKDLIAHGTLFTCLLALKADDRGCDRETIIREVYRAAAAMGDSLTDDLKLLIENFIRTYGKIPKEETRQIKKEVDMTYVASTITEHYIQIGEKRGELSGGVKQLEELRNSGLLSAEDFEVRIKVLKEKLRQLEPESRQCRK